MEFCVFKMYKIWQNRFNFDIIKKNAENFQIFYLHVKVFLGKIAEIYKNFSVKAHLKFKSI